MSEWHFDPRQPQQRWCPRCDRPVHAFFAGARGWTCGECEQRIPGRRRTPTTPQPRPQRPPRLSTPAVHPAPHADAE